MSPIHLGAGLVIGGLVIASLAALELNVPPGAQRFVVKNDFADAKCTMEFFDSSTESFSVAKGREHKKTYKAPRQGFITMRCRTEGKTIEAPGSLYLMPAALTRITLKEDGTAELAFERNKAPR